MRVLSAAVLAAFALSAGAPTPAAPVKEEGKQTKWKKGERPDLKAKEWKKQKSGLEIWDVKEGKGEADKPGGTVPVHYIGWLTDDKATVFDSSVKRNEPATFGGGRQPTPRATTQASRPAKNPKTKCQPAFSSSPFAAQVDK